MSETALIFWQRGIVFLVFLVLLMGGSLIGGSFLNDKKIEHNLGKTTARVVYASPTKSVINFYTSKGVNQNPKLGVLYPSKLREGQTILVEYSKSNPELVRVAGRNHKLAFKPVLFWMAVIETLLVGLIFVNIFFYRRKYK